MRQYNKTKNSFLMFVIDNFKFNINRSFYLMYNLGDSYHFGVFFIAFLYMDVRVKLFFIIKVLFDKTRSSQVSTDWENTFLFLVIYKNMIIKAFNAKLRQLFSPGPTMI